MHSWGLTVTETTTSQCLASDDVSDGGCWL